jgi:MtN3 and saliva related transmembrane protein
MNTEIIGHLAGAIVAIALLPQVIKVYKTKSTKDISILWTLALMFGLVLWVIYAIINTIVPLAIFASLEFLMALCVFIAKLIYK